MTMATKEMLDDCVNQLRGEITTSITESEKKAVTDIDQKVLGLKSDTDTKLSQLYKEIEFLKTMMASNGGNSGHDKTGLTARRSFQSLSKFCGKPEEYPDWHFKILTFFGEGQGGGLWIDLLTKIDKLPTLPTSKEIEEIEQDIVNKDSNVNVKWMNTQLYSVLSLNLSGNALKSIKGLQSQTEQHGYIAWWKIGNESNNMSANKVQALADKVYKPARARNYGETNAHVDEWEQNAKRFEEIEDTKLSNATKINSIKSVVPKELESDIDRTVGLKTYDQVRSYITEQVSMRRDRKSSGPTPMEIGMAAKKVFATLVNDKSEDEKEEKDEKASDHEDSSSHDEEMCIPCGEDGSITVGQLCSFVKGQAARNDGGKGGKPGKGGKFFDGECSGCGKYGHRVRDCWWKDDQRGKGGKSNQYGRGKGVWNNIMAGMPQKGGWKGGKAGSGKGKGAYNLDWNSAPSSSGAWSLMALTKTDKMTEENTKSATGLSLPPGLFETIRLADIMKTENFKDFPGLSTTTN